MGVTRNRLRLPLPPDLREARKVELQKAQVERNEKVSVARAVAEKQIQAAKTVRTYAVAMAEEKLEQARQEIDAEYEAKAAERRTKNLLEEET